MTDIHMFFNYINLRKSLVRDVRALSHASFLTHAEHIYYIEAKDIHDSN